MPANDLSYRDLDRFLREVFEACGVRREAAAIAAAPLMFAETSGVRSHGVSNLAPIYVEKLLSGEIDPRAKNRRIVDSAAIAVHDACSGLGLLASTEAMAEAVERARKFGVGCVAVRNSSHFGPAAYYSRLAACEGMVGLAFSNLGTQAIAPPPLGQRPMVGTNPISVAAPADRLPPFVLDMSTTAWPTGRIRAAARRGEKLPAGVLRDDSGNSVTDPGAYDRDEGRLLMLGSTPETGAHKGFGLALVVEILAGVLSGAATAPSMAATGAVDGSGSSSDRNVGHLFLAIDAGRFRDSEEIGEEMDRMLGAILECTPIGADPVVYPGHQEADNRARCERSVPVESKTFAALIELARELQVRPPSRIQNDE